jgi:hypothetical protein
MVRKTRKQGAYVIIFNPKTGDSRIYLRANTRDISNLCVLSNGHRAVVQGPIPDRTKIPTNRLDIYERELRTWTSREDDGTYIDFGVLSGVMRNLER